MRSDLSNSVHELVKVMEGANKAHQKMIYSIIKHVKDTKNRKLILSPNKEGLHWNLKAYTDSDYAGDAETRKSNATTGNRTKHVDTRYHFFPEYIKKGIVKIVFVRSEDNQADLMTKNIGNELYAKHMKGMFEI